MFILMSLPFIKRAYEKRELVKDFSGLYMSLLACTVSQNDRYCGASFLGATLFGGMDRKTLAFRGISRILTIRTN
jgi:hypothetical protein